MIFWSLICVFIDNMVGSMNNNEQKNTNKTKKTEKRWYILEYNSLEDIRKLINNYRLDIDSLSYLNRNRVAFYVNNMEFLKIGISKTMFPVMEGDKIDNSIIYDKKSTFLIEAHPSWNHSLYKNVHRFYKGLYIATFPLVMNIIQDNDVYSAKLIPNPKLLNRWTVGSVQSSQLRIVYDGLLMSSYRRIHEHGIMGQGEVVSVVDSGIDHELCYFYDPINEIPINKSNPNHRKIVSYYAYGDTTDVTNGHGTHIACAIVGKANCTNCSASLYNGHAPEGKIAFFDAGTSSSPGSLNVEYNFEDVIEVSKQNNVGIISNSWGFPPDNDIIRASFDKIAYENPKMLFVFAAGNSKRKTDIYSPCNSKNCFCVGGSRPFPYNYLESGKPDYLFVMINHKEYPITISSFSKDFLVRIRSDPLPNFQNRQTNGKPFHFGIADGDSICEKIENLTLNNVSAIFISNESIICNQLNIVFLVNKSVLAIMKDSNNVSVLSDYVVNNSYHYEPGFFSSRGPSNSGLIKPEIVAPEMIRSARAKCRGCSADLTVTKEGTSMAVPAVSGSAMLVRQYYRQGFYPYGYPNKESSILPSSSLIKATIITSCAPLTTQTLIPDVVGGFGSIHIGDALFLDNDTPFGTRIADNVLIKPKEDIKSCITIENTSENLIIVISWLDPPMNHDNPIPLNSDLDLYVIDPSGKVFFGNNYDGYEETLSTTERVFIPKKSVHKGKYEIHIRNYAYFDQQPISFALEVKGGFNQTDFILNPELKFQKSDYCTMECNNGDCVNGICLCKEGWTGINCLTKIQKFYGKIELIPRKPVFMFYKIKPSKTVTVYNITIIPKEKRTFFVNCYFSLNQVSKFGGDFLSFVQIKNQSNIFLNVPPSIKTNTKLVISFLLATDLPISLEIIINGNNNMNNNLYIPLSFLIIMILAIIGLVFKLVGRRNTVQKDDHEGLISPFYNDEY